MNNEKKFSIRAVFLLPLVAAAALFILKDAEKYVLVVAHLTLIPALLYPLIYRNSPWRRSPTGKALFNKAVSMALLYTIGVLGYWWPFPHYMELYAVVVTYVGLAITYQFVVMYRLKRQTQRHELLHQERVTP
jgi:hypothetical protein